MREEGEDYSQNNNSPLALTHPLPDHPALRNFQQEGLNLSQLVHELNATSHFYQRPRPDSKGFSDDYEDTYDELDDLLLLRDKGTFHHNDFDPDWCHGLMLGQGEDHDAPLRTLTPALRRLNRKKLPSRVRTQEWINQLENEDRRKNKGDNKPMSENQMHSN